MGKLLNFSPKENSTLLVSSATAYILYGKKHVIFEATVLLNILVSVKYYMII
jgi:hypothetical protein